MAPEFALFLSPDGIALAHRQPAGHWAVLSDTALDVEDLPGALARMRETGEARVGEGFATLVILPDDQILFTSLTAPGPDEEDRIEQIREGLDGLTPYPVDELAFDFVPLEDGRVKLAVVARETLDEAESFARDNGFDPVGFAARPLDNRFPGVAHFDRGPDWTTTISDIEFGHDSWKKASSKPDEAESADADAGDADADGRDEAAPQEARKADAAPGAEDDRPEDAVAADTAPEGEAPDPDGAVEDKADATDAAPAPENQADAEETPDTPADPSPDASPDTAPDAPATPDDETAPDAMAKTDAGADDDAPKVPRPSPTAPEGAEAEAEAEAAPLQVPSGFGAGRAAPEETGRLVRSRSSRLGIGGSAPAGPELSRKPQGSDPDQPRFGRGTKDSAPSDKPLRPSLAGPEPDLPPLTRTKLRARQQGAADMPVPPPVAPPGPRAAPADQAADAPSKAGSGTGSGAGSRASNALTGLGKRLASGANKARAGAAAGIAARRKSPSDKAETPSASQKPASAGIGSITGRLKTLARKSPQAGADDRAEEGSADPPRQADAARDEIAPPPARRPRFQSPKTRRATAIAAAPPPPADADASLTGGLLARGSLASQRGPSLRTGLILTLILLAVLGLIAIWAAVYLPNSSLAGWLGMDRDEPTIETASPAPQISDTPQLPGASADGSQGDPALAALAPEATAPQGSATAPDAPDLLPDIDADLDLGPTVEAPPRIDPETLLPTREENESFYALTGIWQRPPVIDLPVPDTVLDGVLLASLDPAVVSHDAIALSLPRFNLAADLPRRQSNPLDPETEFVFDDNGFVVPTAEGAINPDGVLIYAGAPVFTPPQRPNDAPAAVAAAAAEAAADALAEAEDGADAPAATPPGGIDPAVLAAARPVTRPGDLQEQRERFLLGGISFNELAAIRPATRPASIQELAAAEAAAAEAEAEATAADDPADITTTSPMAVAVSFVPPTRPGNIDALVAAARAAGNSGPTPPAVASASDRVQPDIPSSASVTRAATQENAINLRRINLIGVTGSASDRRALVRLPSGRFVTVEPGDRLDGGRVAAIGEDSLQYVKSGRTITLEVPAG